MEDLSSGEVLPFLIILTILFFIARLMGELFRKFKLPAVMGELIGGIILGPSLLGALFPDLFNTIFVHSANSFLAFDGISRLGIIFLLFVAGMEVDLTTIRKRGKAASKISFMGVFFPFATGFAATWFIFDQFLTSDHHHKVMASLFIGTALSITALSVLAKILIDLDMIRSRFGNLMMTAAMINDFIGWLLFSIVLTVGDLKHEAAFSTWQVFVLVILFTATALTIGRKVIDGLFGFCENYLAGKGASLSLAMFLCLAGGIFTEWIGLHALFGAFITGIAVGDSKKFSANSKEVLHDIVTYIFAPLFFISIGLRVNFIANFNWVICLFILAIAVFGKLAGSYLGARLSGFKVNKAWAVGFGMNARGSQEIILGLIALQAKIIDEEIFVGLVVMTFVTIFIAGPAIKYFLRKHDDEIMKKTNEKEKAEQTGVWNSLPSVDEAS